MARQGTAKQAIDAQNGVTPPVTPPVAPVAPTTPTPINTPAPVTAPAPITPPTVPAQPRVEGQWNYGTAENQVLAPTPVQTPANPATPVEKPKTANEAIAQGYKQEIKPVNPAQNAPLTTEIGREAKLGQLPNVQQTQNQIEQEKINTQNLKSASGQQLWSNLDTISKNNPELLNSRSAYDKAFGYQNKDYGERALVDAFWNAKKNDANGLYNALATGQKLPDGASTTPAFHDALIRHQDVTQFENLNPYLLSKKLGTELLPGTQVYNDLMAKNPQLVTDAQKLASINMPVTARSETKTNWQDTMSAYLSRSPVMQNPTTVATIMNSDPNIAVKTNEVQEVENKLTDAKDRLKKVQENVTERYKGTGATKQTINAKALAESQDIIDEITMLEANKASASSALTTLITNAKDNYTMARQDRQDALNQYNQGFQQLQAMAEMGMKQDEQEYQRQQDSVNRDLQLLQYYTNIDQANAKEARAYQFQEQSDLRNFDQQKELAKMGYQNQYNMANLGFNQDMAKLGMQQSYNTQQNATAQQNEMIKAAMSQGATYQDAVNQVMGTSGLGDIRGMASQFPNQAWAKNNNPAGITWNANFDNPQIGSTAYALQQAGIKFSKGTPRPGNEGGNYVTFDTIEDGIRAQRIMMEKTYGNSTVGKMLQSWVGTSEGPNYAKQVAGNAGIGTDVRVSTLSPEQMDKLQMAKIQKESPGLYKMLTQQQVATPTQSTTKKEVSANAKSWVDAWDKGTMDLETILKEIGSSKEAAPLKNEVMQYVASRGGVAYRPPTDSNVVQLQKKVDELDELIANDEHMEDVSGMLQMSPWDTLTSKKQDYLSRVDNILQGNVLQKLIDAKAAGATLGALSDAELKMLQSTSSALMGRALKDNDKVTGFDISTPEMKRQLQLLRDGYAASIDKMTGRVSLSEKSNATPVNQKAYDATKARLEQLKASRNK